MANLRLVTVDSAPMKDTATSARYDALIIGGGHNGLVAAAYLARAGLRTVVLERRELIGGAAVTEELFPGFKFSRAAYVNSLLRPKIIDELELRRHGLEFLPRNPSSFTPLLDGRSLLLGPDAGLNQREIAKFSERDAATFPRYEAFLDRAARCIEPALDRVPPDLAASGVAERLRSLAGTVPLLCRTARLGRDLPQFLKLLTAPASQVLSRWFESEPLRATLATDAVIGAMASPATPGSGYVLFHHVMGESDGARGVWSYVRGGMGKLSDAIGAAAEAAGAEVRRSAAVAKILVESGHASGVVLDDGTELRARVVLSSVDPHWTFLRLLPDGTLPDEIRRDAEAIDYSSGVTKINVALDRLPQFSALPGDGVGPHHHGTMHFVQTMEEIEEAYRDALGGEPSRRPVIEATLPSALDDSLAPPGKHVLSLFVQYTPYHLRAGSWDDEGRREAFADRVFDVIEEFVPGFKSSVLFRDILTPPDLERIFGLTGGNIFHGAMSLDQLFWLRPFAGWSRYRTPVEGLYLCGSGAHPGGGVLGSPGRNAAQVVLRDFA